MCENNPNQAVSSDNKQNSRDSDVEITSKMESLSINGFEPELTKISSNPAPRKDFIKNWVNNSTETHIIRGRTSNSDGGSSSEDILCGRNADRQSESSDSGYHKKTGDGDSCENSAKDVEVLSDPCDIDSNKETSGALSPTSSNSITIGHEGDLSSVKSVHAVSNPSDQPVLEVSEPCDSGPPDDHVLWSDMCDSDILTVRNADGQEIKIHNIPAELWPDEWDGGGEPLFPGDSMDPPCENEVYFQRHIPKHYAGIIFGKKGKNLRDLRDRLGGKIQLVENPENPNFQTLHMFCPKENLKEVKRWLQQKINIGYRNDSSYNSTNISNPHQLVQFLPEGEVVPIIPLGMPSKTELFVQIYVPGEYEEFVEFQSKLNQHYSTEDCPRLPIPVSVGVVCVAPYTDGRYYRAKITHRAVTVNNEELALVMYLDYGGFMWHPISSLHKIRSEFMDFNFQATLIKWAHAMPINPIPQDEIYNRYMAGRLLYAYGVTMMPCCVTHAVLYIPMRPVEKDNVFSPNPRDLVDILGQAVLDGHYQVVPYTLPERLEEDGVGGYCAPEVGAFTYLELCTLVDLESIREHRKAQRKLEAGDNCDGDDESPATPDEEEPRDENSRDQRPARFNRQSNNGRGRWNQSKLRNRGHEDDRSYRQRSQEEQRSPKDGHIRQRPRSQWNSEQRGKAEFKANDKTALVDTVSA